MLTGKCKEDFEKWYLKNHKTYTFQTLDNLSLSFQYGVYVDFFDSVGIYIQISFYDFDSMNWQLCIECIEDKYDYSETHLISREEAREQAIKKANEIYNSIKKE